MTTRILIVDDDTTNLYMLEALLKGYGYDVTSAENGREALEKARIDPPDLIVTDILMPVMDGYALCREWKSDDALKGIPLIFYTATYTSARDEAFAMGLGADRFVLKPQEPDALIAVIQEVLADHREGCEPSTPLGDEMEFLRQHNESLFRKLEQKMSDLETTNRELRALDERYRLSFENVSDIICTIGTDLVITDISPSIKRLMGLKPEDIIGRSVTIWEQFLTRESFELLMNNIHRILEGEIIPSATYEFILNNGTTAYSDISGSPLVHDGEIIGLITVARDITGRKRAEEKLQAELEKREELEFIVNHSPAVVWLWKAAPGWPVEYVSDSITRFGYTPDDFTGGRIAYPSIVHPDDLPRVGEEVERYTAEGKTEYTQEYRIIAKSGAIRWIDDRTWVRRGTDGSVTHYQGIAVDITDRRETENALQEAYRRLDDIIDFLPDATFAVDREGKVITWNKSMERMTGIPTTDMVGKGNHKYAVPLYGRQRRILADLIIRPDDDFERSHYENVHRHGETVYAESHAPCIYGGKGAFMWSIASPLFDTAGHIIGAIESIRDITDRKQALDRLKSAIETTIQVVVATVEARDPYTAGHQIRVAQLARAIAEEMKLPSEKIDGIFRAASIHDIGKLSIPAEILTKPTALTDIEFALIKEHPKKGYEILKDVASDWPLAEIVWQHHERMDGSGYPRGLKGDEILLEARILAVADVVEAMASHRPYRPSLGIEPALEEIANNGGIFYDPDVVDACLRLFHEKGYAFTLP